MFVSNTFEQYANDPTNFERLFDVLTYGLEEAIEFAQRAPSVKAVDEAMQWRDHAAIVEYLELMALQNIVLKLSRTYGGCKQAMLELRSSVAGTIAVRHFNKPNEYERRFMEYCLQVSEQIRDVQKSTQSLESVITSYSPIVPYTGQYIKKPFESKVDEKVEKSILEKMMNGVSTIAVEADTQIVGGSVEAIRRHCMSRMLQAVEQPPILAQLLEHAEMYSSIDGPESFVSMVTMQEQVPDSMRNVVAYGGWVWMYQNAETIASDDAEVLINSLTNIDRVAFRQAVESVEAHLPDDQQTLLDYINTTDRINRSVNVAFGASNGEKEMNDLNNFDLDKLLAFIYNARRFEANSYTNREFVKGQNLGGYIFYKQFLFIMPNSAENQKLDFMYCPVIDNLNDRKPAVIKFWKDGTIDVLSERQYYAQIDGNGVTPV